MEFKKRLVHIRDIRKMRQQDVADKIGVCRNAVTNWETGATRPKVARLERLAKVLDVSFEWLATGRGSMYAHKLVTKE